MGEAGSSQNQGGSVQLNRLCSAKGCTLKWASHIRDTADLCIILSSSLKMTIKRLALQTPEYYNNFLLDRTKVVPVTEAF